VVGGVRGQRESTGASDAIILATLELRVVWCNPAAEQTLGLLAKDIIGKTFPEILNADSGLANAILEQLAASGRWNGGATLARERRGARVSITAEVLKDETGDPAVITAILRPSSDRAASKAFDKSSSFAPVLDMLCERACIIDSEYNIVYLNAALEKISGYPRTKCYEHFFGRTDACPWCARFEKVFRKGVAWKSTYTSRGRTYEYADSSFMDSLGRPRILRIFHDVTEYVRTAEAFMDYRHQLEDVLGEYKAHMQRLSRILEGQADEPGKSDSSIQRNGDYSDLSDQ